MGYRVQNDEACCGSDGRSAGLDPAWNIDTLGIQTIEKGRAASKSLH